MHNPFKKEQIISKRTFSYSKGSVSLSFNLDLGNKPEMGKFKELLEQALLDVSEEIDKDIYSRSGGSGKFPIERESNE